MRVTVTDHSTYLTLHLPTGDFIIHAASTERPSGFFTHADVTPHTFRTKPYGYLIDTIIAADGAVLTLPFRVHAEPSLITPRSTHTPIARTEPRTPPHSPRPPAKP